MATYTLIKHGMVRTDSGGLIGGNAELYEIDWTTGIATGAPLATAALGATTGIWSITYASADTAKNYTVVITPSTVGSTQRRYVLMTNEQTANQLVVIGTSTLLGNASVGKGLSVASGLNVGSGVMGAGAGQIYVSDEGLIGVDASDANITFKVRATTSLITVKNADLQVDGALVVSTLSGSPTISGALAVSGALTVTGASTLRGAVGIEGKVSAPITMTLRGDGYGAVTGAIFLDTDKWIGQDEAHIRVVFKSGAAAIVGGNVSVAHDALIGFDGYDGDAYMRETTVDAVNYLQTYIDGTLLTSISTAAATVTVPKVTFSAATLEIIVPNNGGIGYATNDTWLKFDQTSHLVTVVAAGINAAKLGGIGGRITAEDGIVAGYDAVGGTEIWGLGSRTANADFTLTNWTSKVLVNIDGTSYWLLAKAA